MIPTRPGVKQAEQASSCFNAATAHFSGGSIQFPEARWQSLVPTLGTNIRTTVYSRSKQTAYREH